MVSYLSDYDDVPKLSACSLRWGSKRVLLREPEKCLTCEREFLSLYPLKKCAEHAGLDEL